MIPDTLGNLPDSHHLWGRCPACDRYFDVDVARLVKRLGPDCQTTEAMRRVTCRECGRHAEIWRGHGVKRQLR